MYGHLGKNSLHEVGENGESLIDGLLPYGQDSVSLVAKDSNGSERLPTLSPGWGATTLGWDGAYGISDGAVLNNTPAGTWGVVARLADISFFEDLTHTLAVGFYTGTNNTRMVTSGPVDGIQGGNVYLTTKDHAWEVNFDSQYKLYENLTLAAEMGLVRLDLDKDVWGSKLNGVDKTAYKVGLNLNYAF